MLTDHLILISPLFQRLRERARIEEGGIEPGKKGKDGAVGGRRFFDLHKKGHGAVRVGRRRFERMVANDADDDYASDTDVLLPERASGAASILTGFVSAQQSGNLTFPKIGSASESTLAEKIGAKHCAMFARKSTLHNLITRDG